MAHRPTLPPAPRHEFRRRNEVVLGSLVELPAVGQPVQAEFGNARLSLVYVEDVAEQFIALLRAPERAFARRRFFNSGGNTCTVREVAEVVRRLLPDARIDVRAAGEADLAGLAASVSDVAMEQEVGYTRRFKPLEVAVRAHVNAARRQAGLAPV